MSYTKEFKDLDYNDVFKLEQFDSDNLNFALSEEIDYLKETVGDYTVGKYEYIYCSNIKHGNYNYESTISFNRKFFNELYANLKEEGKAYELSFYDTDYNYGYYNSFDEFLNNAIIQVFCPNGTLEESYEVLQELARDGESGYVPNDLFDELFDYRGNRARSQEVMKDIVKVVGDLYAKCRAEYPKLKEEIDEIISNIDSLSKCYGDVYDKFLAYRYEDTKIVFDDDGNIEGVEL